MLKPVGLQIGLDDPFWKKIPFGQKHVVDVTVEGTQVTIGEWRLRARTKRCGVQLFLGSGWDYKRRISAGRTTEKRGMVREWLLVERQSEPTDVWKL